MFEKKNSVKKLTPAMRMMPYAENARSSRRV
jgi:hypothetical protein